LYAPLIASLTRVSHPADANADKFQAFAGLNPRGVIDFQWIAALDPALAEPGRSQVYNVHRTKDGGLGYAENSDALSGESFAALEAFVRAKLGALADRWLDGDISIEPRRFRKRLPCGDCEYRCVCRFETGASPMVHLQAMSRGDVVTRLAGRDIQ